jgi:hypothetical protein
VRPWLVVVGVVFLTLAGGTLAILFLGGDGNPTTVVTPYAPFSLGPNVSQSLTLDGSNGSSEQFSLVWHSSAPIIVSLLEPQACSGNCSQGRVLFSWPSNLSGAWSGTGPFHYPLQCLVRNTATHSSTVSLTGRAVASTPTHFGLEVEVILGSGAAGLFLVGGLAIFLGLFLRGDPYGPRPPLVSQSADDVEEIAEEPPPDH